MATPEDRLIAFGSPTPMLACEKGVEDYPGYLDCQNCAWTEFCDIYKTETARREADKFIENQIAQGFESADKYFVDEFGHYALDKKYSAKLQKKLNEKVLTDYQADLNQCKNFSDKVGAFFRMIKNAWIHAKNNHK